LRVERLGADHRLAGFDCGVEALDDWLTSHALDNQRRNLSRTFVLVDDAGRVVGYYSLTMGGARREALPPRYGRGLPSYEIGMVLLARLAVDRSRQGEGLGRDLLIEAIERAAAAGEQAAARFIAVDPIDENARAFYMAFGFKSVSGGGERRMYLRIDEALKALEDRSQ
jgi:GNAT superfamily N-acetyltransferase